MYGNKRDGAPMRSLRAVDGLRASPKFSGISNQLSTSLSTESTPSVSSPTGDVATLPVARKETKHRLGRPVGIKKAKSLPNQDSASESIKYTDLNGVS